MFDCDLSEFFCMKHQHTQALNGWWCNTWKQSIQFGGGAAIHLGSNLGCHSQAEEVIEHCLDPGRIYSLEEMLLD